MTKQFDRNLADELVKKKYIAQEDVDKCLSSIQSSQENLSSYLTRLGFVSEDKILEAFADALSLQTVDLKTIEIEKSVTETIPVKFVWYYKFMPISIKDKVLTLARAIPLDVKIQDEIRVHLGLLIKDALAPEKDVVECLKKSYGVAAETIDKIATKEPEKESVEKDRSELWVEDLEKESQDASVAKLVNQILLDAYHKRATDIHIEPYRDIVRLRYRVDGVLVDANLPHEAIRFVRPILSRIKIMANLSIEERRLPQDGSAIVKTKEQDLDLRISTVPTPRGESMVIRILPTKVMLYGLEKLGIDRQMVRDFRELIKRPHGIVFATGPTGSGKTTTLYACLNEINSMEKKIITIEDPVEFEMEGITQIQVNSKVSFDFARGLRSILRHDPDIIMVGEVRDFETAEIAIRTALTGHLVFSTLHTNDASSGVTRLIDMGLEPFLVASSIEAFVAQRLVRVICSKCKEEVRSPMLEIREEIAASLQLKSHDDVKIFAGKGCNYCNKTGYLGRTAIYEMLTINEEIREAILEKGRTEEIKQIAMRHGMKTLRQTGWQKVIEGITTPKEVLENTVKDKTVSIVPAKIPVPQKAPKEVAKVAKKIQVSNASAEEAKKEYESRVYSRLNEKIGIRFEILKKDENNPEEFLSDNVEHSTVTKDISAGGIRFAFGKTLPAGTLLLLKIQLNKDERSIDCMGKVCRVEDDNKLGQYNIVAYYLDISSADRVKINNYVELKMNENKNNE